MAGQLDEEELEKLVVPEEFATKNAGDPYGGLMPGSVAYIAEFRPDWSVTAQQRNYNSIVTEIPTVCQGLCGGPALESGPLRKYRVSAKNGATMRIGVSLRTELVLQGAMGPVPKDAVVLSDDEVFSDTGDLRVHIIVPNTTLGMGWVSGWVSFKTLTPLCADGSPLPKPTLWTHDLTVRLQANFEWGYKQASVQTLIRKIKSDVDELKQANKGAEGKKKVPTFREYVDALWMKVRGPALAKCGMSATLKGLDAQQAMEHFEYGENDETYGIMDAHNRIVQLMAAHDPSKVPSAKAMAEQGKKTVMLAAPKVNEKGDLSVT